MYGFKKELQKAFKLKFSIHANNNVLLTANLDGNLFYFIPRYLNCTNWNVDFESFENFLLELSPTNFCIVGDLNARVGDEQILDPNLLHNLPHINKIRHSKDTTCNAKGSRLIDLVENLGGIVLNGRTVGDEQGEYSFCGGSGSSVIDYCIGSQSFLNFVDDFSIACKPYSDHMPLVLKLIVPMSYNRAAADSVPQRIRWNDKFALKYSENITILTRNTNFTPNISVDEMVLSVKNKILKANVTTINKFCFEPKQKWFNWKCARSRKNMMKLLNKYRKKHTNANKAKYLSAKAKYLRICKNSKLELYEKNLEQLNFVNCSKAWWKLSNGMKTRTCITRGDLTSEDFHTHFSTMLENTEQANLLQWCMPCFTDAFLDSPIELYELSSVLRSLKHNKAPGSDGISYEFYRYAPVCFVNEILCLLNQIFLKETIPSSFKTSILIPLLKKGDPNSPTNYRGLSLIDTLCKIFNNILLNRITNWIDVNNILNEYQAGFRKNYSTIDNVFNLANIVHLNKLNGKNTYAFFVDFSCAFDMIPRNSLFYKLSCMGLSSKIIRILQLYYENNTSQVLYGNTFSDPFSVDNGVKQGCILSPILFALYLNDLAEALPGGVNVVDEPIKILLYADDIVILSDSPNILQNMIDKLYTYCNIWSLKVNLAKSKILIFRSGTRISNNLKWNYGEDDIEIVNNYRYLGMDLNFNLSFKKHIENKLTTSKMAISSTWARYINHPKISNSNKLKIFNAASKSIMFYGAQIWGFKKYDEVEKLFRFFIKKMLHLPSNTPNYMLYIETGLNSLYVNTLKLHFDYINKALHMPSCRLPRILAEKVIAKKTYWAEEWITLRGNIKFVPDNAENPICLYSKQILDLLSTKEREDLLANARNSQFHDLYSQVDYCMKPLSALDLSSRAASLIIRARGGLLDINARAFKSSSVGLCSLCNLDATENTLHLIGICPIYYEFRLKYFGKTTLDLNEVLNILNGAEYDYFTLYKYLEICLKYRKLLLNEFE